VAHRRLDQARSEVQRSTSAAAVADRLVQASLGTQASADTAHGRAATSAGAVAVAQGGLALLAAGARREDVAAAEAEAAGIASQLAQLRSDDALLTLRSPIDGIVATPHLEDKRQATLAPGDLFAEVQDLDAAIAEIALAPTDPLAEIHIGDEVALQPYGAPHGAVRARIARLRTLAQDTSGEPRIIAVTSPFTLEHPLSGLTGHARIYGAEHSLAYANLYLPLQRLVGVRLWSM